jgi:hypothetical protein
MSLNGEIGISNDVLFIDRAKVHNLVIKLEIKYKKG